MLRTLALAALLTGLAAPTLPSQDRTMTLAGDGFVERGRGNRRDVREVRMTLRENGDFAATLVTDDGRLLLRGSWRRQGMGNVERIEIREGLGGRSRGDGMLTFADRSHEVPRRLVLEGDGRDGRWRVSIARGDGDRDDDRPGRPGRGSYGNGDQVYRNIDAAANGDGRTQMQGVRGGAFSMARARLGTGGDAIIDISEPTSGQIRGRVRDVTGDRIEVGVTSVYGYRATGTLTVTLRSDRELRGIIGEGGGERGRWTLDFRGRGLPDGSPSPGTGGGGRDDEWDEGRFTMSGDERGSGRLVQDVGTSLDLVRVSVRLRDDREGRIALESRNETAYVYGRWMRASNGRIDFDISRINTRRADGRITIRPDGRSFRSLGGDGRTGGGRFTVSFDAR